MNILVIGDTHWPGQDDGYLAHVKFQAERFSADKVVHVGDLADFHYISRHQTEPEALNPMQELALAQEEASLWVKAFPEVCVCIGNHDSILLRQAKTIGCPEFFLKSMSELLSLPSSWVFKRRHIIHDIVFEHGLGSNGMYGPKRTASVYRKSYVQGHTHSHAGVFWIDSPFDRIFGMQVGCGVDPNKYFMKYGREVYKHGLALGCGIILDADTKNPIPLFIPMEHGIEED